MRPEVDYYPGFFGPLRINRDNLSGQKECTILFHYAAGKNLERMKQNGTLLAFYKNICYNHNRKQNKERTII